MKIIFKITFLKFQFMKITPFLPYPFFCPSFLSYTFPVSGIILKGHWFRMKMDMVS